MTHGMKPLSYLAMVFLEAIFFGALPAPALAQACGDLGSYVGAADYRFEKHKLPVVENRHFTPAIEALISGTTSSSVEGDLSYTLDKFPNHTRALVAVIRLAQRKKSLHPTGLRYSVDCFFERALRFRSDDVVVRMLYANWLSDTDRRESGLSQLGRIDAGDNPITAYNVGLVYAQLGDYDKALDFAHKARFLGSTQEGLQQILHRAGRWREPVPSATATSASGVSRPTLENLEQ